MRKWAATISAALLVATAQAAQAAPAAQPAQVVQAAPATQTVQPAQAVQAASPAAPVAVAATVPKAIDVTVATPPQPVGQLQPVNAPKTGLYVNLPANRLYHYENGKLIKQYPIAIGRPNAPTPTGEYRIVSKLIDPTWYPTDGSKPVAPGPANPLGRRWLGLDLPAYGIHGNNAPASIGQSISAGCIRMRNEDVEALFEVIPHNFPVKIVYEPIELLQDEAGNQFLIQHPDIYSKKATITQKLAQLGLPRVWAANLQLGSEPSPFASPVAIGQTVTRGYWVGGELWVGARPAALGLRVPLGYQDGQVTLAGQPVTTELGDGASFASTTHLTEILGGLGGPMVSFQGQELGRIARWLDGQWQLPLRQVANALGRQVGWGEAGATLDGRPIHGTLVGGSLYVALDEWERHGFLPNLAPTGIEDLTPNSL